MKHVDDFLAGLSLPDAASGNGGSLCDPNLIHDLGYIESGATYSAEMLVLCNELVSWMKAFRRGAPVNDETLALDLIDELGFTTDFLASDHTLARYREQWAPDVLDRDNHQAWQAKGSPDLREKIRARIDLSLAGAPSPALPAGVRQELARISQGPALPADR